MVSKPKLLFTSSCENYAGTYNSFKIPIPTPEEVQLCVEDVFNPRWSYASSKILGEVACIHYSNKFKFPVSIVRYHNIFGPRMGFQHVIPEFTERLFRNNEQMDMFGGDQYRSFCYVEDAAHMTINIMNEKNADNRVVNIGNSNEIRIKEVAERIAQILKISPEFIEKGAPEGSVTRRAPDLTLIKEINCYRDAFSFQKGLEITVDWYIKYFEHN
jgi:UDP-glucose 4-epimerase/UDP-glucuronate decarboxylase